MFLLYFSLILLRGQQVAWEVSSHKMQRYKRASHMVNPEPKIEKIDSDSSVEGIVSSHIAKDICNREG